VIEIREMTPDGAAPVVDAVLRGGWGDRTTFYRFAVENPACTTFIAWDGDAIAATGTAIRQGRVGWVGMIWTDPDRRGRGLGRAITERVMTCLTEGGCVTILLIASTMGRPVYERLGFEPVGAELQFATTARVAARLGLVADPAPANPLPAIRTSRPGDLAALRELDRAATDEERDHLLGVVEARGLVAEGAGGDLAGYLVDGPFDRLAVVARDSAAAATLIRHHAVGPAADAPISICLPEGNLAGVAALRAASWPEGSRGLRMVLGPLPAWRPELIFGGFSFATG
jgi:GNAT superfamily N-acetyltransferase